MAAATRGLSRAAGLAADAAQRVAAGGATDAAAGGAKIATAGGASPEGLIAAMGPAPDLGRAAVDLLVARRAYAANAAVLRSADRMAEALLRRSA
jgi:hypothetical protein